MSPSTLAKMEQKGTYRLPQRTLRSGTRLEAVARALSVPLGYLLAGFPEAEVRRSVFGPRVARGEIQLQDQLDDRGQSFADFLKTLPTDEHKLLEQPFYSFRNAHAFAIIFRLERIFSGREELIVNDPPLIFWDDDDVTLWIRNMGLSEHDGRDFRKEFQNYQEYFRTLARKGKKSYRVVLNAQTFQHFLERKTAAAKRRLLDLLIEFVGVPTFHLVLLNPPAGPMIGDGRMDELEIICKTSEIPPSLEGTLSVVIKQTPVDVQPTEYFVAPSSLSNYLLQRERRVIESAWQAALQQYEVDFKVENGITEEMPRRLTSRLLARIRGGAAT